MLIEEGPLVVQPVPETPKSESQPAPAATPAQDVPEMSDAAVREAIARAEAQGINPETLTIGDLSQGNESSPKPEVPPPAEPPKPQVPDKFKKADGEVDVEKLKDSTTQLAEAVQKKETAVQKTVDDYLREYRDMENKFRNLPNPQKLAEGLPKAPPQPAPEASPYNMTDDQLRQAVAQQIGMSPQQLDATTALIEMAIAKRIEPFEREKKITNVRSNIEQLAKKDARVLNPDIFAAITNKLNQDPDLWNLKNPHKAAWLEVKEELQLGEPSKAAPAQPSVVASPILGGGTPPSAPSSSAPKSSPETLLSLDPRKKDQEALGDQVMRELLSRGR